MSTTHQITEYKRKVYVERTMHIIECARCGIDFGIGDEYMSARRKDHGTFYCPSGHPNWYPEDNTEERLRKDLERARKRAQDAWEYTERERQRRLTAERQRAAAKGQVTKIKNRVGKGVCPCCNRTFQNLGKHMAGQHPEWVGE